MSTVRLVPLDPYDGTTGLLIPFVLERVRAHAAERISEMDPTQLMARVGARVYNRDASIKLVAFLDAAGKVVGHAVASIETDGLRHWLFVMQVQVDPGDWGDSVIQALKMADAWAQEFSARVLIPQGRSPIRDMMMATHRSDKAWQKRYGFEVRRYLMGREVGSKPPADKGE